LADFFVEEVFGVFEGALAFGGEVLAAAILVEVQHAHGLAGAFGGNFF
jgi:hypothetical protein